MTNVTARSRSPLTSSRPIWAATSLNFWVATFREVQSTALRSGPLMALQHHPREPSAASSAPPPPAQKLKAKRFTASPNPPRAGESFVIELDVVDAKTGKAVYGAVTCKGRLRGKAFNGTDFTRRGASFCVFDVPQSAAGSVLTGRSPSSVTARR